MAAVDSLTWSVPSIGPQNLPDAQPAPPATHHGFSFRDFLESLSPFHHDAPPGAPAAEAQHGFSFHDVLNIVNPLQHFPVVGTLYRKITGDEINTFDKIAGDTLYGGAMGFASAMADTVFKAVTGKYFGDEVLALVLGDGSNDTAVAQAAQPSSSAPSTQIAQAAPVQPVPFIQPETALASVGRPEVSALPPSLLGSAIDPLRTQRALFAYQRATGLSLRPIALADAALATP